MTERLRIPASNEAVDDLARRLSHTIERTDVLAGARGDAALFDRAVTFRDLVDLGLVPLVVAQQQARAVRR